MTDAELMDRAFALAERAEGLVSPRPPVGCVIAAPDGTVLAEGWTRADPIRHAEADALLSAGDKVRGATAFVTLEPCAHTGSTPPCADALIEAGVARVVAALRDPDPRTRGRGLSRLRRAGVDVRTGVRRARAQALYEPFATRVALGRPFVTLKLAASLDGKLAAPDGTSRWITGEAARADVHDLRSRVDAILTGAGTIAADDPELTARCPERPGHRPARVILDSTGRTPATARVFGVEAPTIVLTTASVAEATRSGWQSAGADVRVLPSGEGGVDLAAVAAELGRLGFCHVLAECGPTLAGALISAGLVDRFRLYLAPLLIGGDAPGLLADGVKTLTDAWRMRIEKMSRVGDDVRIDTRRA